LTRHPRRLTAFFFAEAATAPAASIREVATVRAATAASLGVSTILVAVAGASIPVFFLGTIVAGMGFGAGFQGAIRTVVPLAAPHERAGVLSIIYLVSYLALGLPAVIGGLRVVYGGGVLTTAREYGATVIALSLFALLGTLSRSVRGAGHAPVP
jgi:hypothetical protein